MGVHFQWSFKTCEDYYNSMLCYTNYIPYHPIPYHSIPSHTIPYHSIPSHTIPYHAIPYHTIPYHTIPYHTILYYTILLEGSGDHQESIYGVIHVVFLGVIPLCYVSVSVAGVMLFGADTPEDILVEFQGNYVMEASESGFQGT